MCIKIMVRTDLQEMLSPVVSHLGYELLGIEQLPQGKHSLVRLYIDTETGITIEDCEKVSREVSAVLDVEDPISGNYSLEVSSPGLDRPLFSLDHYRKFIGKESKIRLHSPVNGKRRIKGIIQNVVDDLVIIQTDEETLNLDLSQIEKANLVAEIQFNR